MKLQFEANQEYQLDAIAAVVDVFRSIQKGEGGRRIAAGNTQLDQGNAIWTTTESWISMNAGLRRH